jgi:hypothetical protein
MQDQHILLLREICNIVKMWKCGVFLTLCVAAIGVIIQSGNLSIFSEISGFTLNNHTVDDFRPDLSCFGNISMTGECIDKLSKTIMLDIELYEYLHTKAKCLKFNDSMIAECINATTSSEASLTCISVAAKKLYSCRDSNEISLEVCYINQAELSMGICRTIPHFTPDNDFLRIINGTLMLLDVMFAKHDTPHLIAKAIACATCFRIENDIVREDCLAIC